jgi:crotonobetainyl-CoA:carnitine CoA-transferase CaiB-like acyl-CoA transferase
MDEARPTLVPPFGPLAGLRVVDSGRLVAGPWAATHLAEFGAEVIHVEGPPYGPPYSDPTRSIPPMVPEGAERSRQVSESWVQYARNKLSLAMDLRDPEGRALFLELLRRSDIWIESSRPGTYDRLGLDDRTVLRESPRLTIVHVSGFGQSGREERVRSASFDLIGQAYSGFLALQGPPDPAPPSRSGTALNDTVTGLAAAGAALMGYVAAQRTGRGQSVDVAQYEVFFQLLENLALDYFLRGVVRGRHGTAHPRLYPYDLYRAADGWVVVAAPTAESWERLRRFVGLPEGAFDDPAERRARRGELDAHLERFCRERPSAELEAAARAADVAISRIYDMAMIAEEPHYVERGMFLEWDDPVAGRVKGLGIVPKFATTPGGVWRGSPRLGEDTRRVLAERLGLPTAEIERLLRAGIVGEEPTPAPPEAPAPERA